MNWLEAAYNRFRGRRQPYSGPPRYFGPLRLISFMGRPAIIGNSMNIRRDLPNMGFRWDGNIRIDGTPLGDAPDNVINGAWVGTRALSPEESQQLSTMGVDISMQGQDFPIFQGQPTPPQPVTPGQPQPTEPIPQTEQEGAQSDAENVEMIMRLREAASRKDRQGTEEVIQDQLRKLMGFMSNPNLSEAQKELRDKFIKFMSSAHKYSFFNTILIFMQRTDAEMVGGEKNLWNNKGRQLRQGEQPIWVLAPVFRKPYLSREQYQNLSQQFAQQGVPPTEIRKKIDEWKDARKMLTGFKDVPVFDYKQTDPIPGWQDPKTGEPPFQLDEFHHSYRNKMNQPDEYADALFSATKKAAIKNNIQVSQKGTGSAGGFSSGGNIVIDESSVGERRVATMFHEWAHEVLHQGAENRDRIRKEQTPKKLIELEAEATAFLLSQAFDIQGDPQWAARYILLWEATPQDVMDRQQNIHRAYSTIFKEVQKELDRIIESQPQQTAQPAAMLMPAAFVRSWLSRLKTA